MNVSATTYSGISTYPPAGNTYGATSAVPGAPAENSQPFSPKVNPKSQDTATPSSGPEKNQADPSSKDQYSSQTQTVNGRELDQKELQLVEELKKVDQEVRRHEMAHIAAGGRYITSGANFSYKKGPDGKNYAVGGEVSIDTSPVPGDPQATIQKMRQVKSAALAPANPSAQDLKVAANATSQVSKALSELMVMQAKEQAESNETQAFGGLKKAADSYEKVNNLPETDTASFEIAV